MPARDSDTNATRPDRSNEPRSHHASGVGAEASDAPASGTRTEVVSRDTFAMNPEKGGWADTSSAQTAGLDFAR